MVAGRRRIGEGERSLLDRLVPCGQAALVLAEMFFPGRDAEYLGELVRSFTVSIQLPAGCSGSESRSA